MCELSISRACAPELTMFTDPWKNGHLYLRAGCQCTESTCSQRTMKETGSHAKVASPILPFIVLRMPGERLLSREG